MKNKTIFKILILCISFSSCDNKETKSISIKDLHVPKKIYLQSENCALLNSNSCKKFNNYILKIKDENIVLNLSEKLWNKEISQYHNFKFKIVSERFSNDLASDSKIPFRIECSVNYFLFKSFLYAKKNKIEETMKWFVMALDAEVSSSILIDDSHLVHHYSSILPRITSAAKILAENNKVFATRIIETRQWKSLVSRKLEETLGRYVINPRINYAA